MRHEIFDERKGDVTHLCHRFGALVSDIFVRIGKVPYKNGQGPFVADLSESIGGGSSYLLLLVFEGIYNRIYGVRGIKVAEGFDSNSLDVLPVIV